MADVTIRMRPNGPLVIEGPFKLVDSRGAEFEIPPNKPAVALCRCGAVVEKTVLRRHAQNVRLCLRRSADAAGGGITTIHKPVSCASRLHSLPVGAVRSIRFHAIANCRNDCAPLRSHSSLSPAPVDIRH